MSWEMLVLLLNLLLASCSLVAAITVAFTWRAQRLRLDAHSTRSLSELDSVVAALELSLASNSTTLRRLSSRIGMQALRERRKGESETDQPPADPRARKAWLQQNLRLGKLRVVRDGGSAAADEGA